MKMYYATILDHKGKEVLNLKVTGTAKHSAFLAAQFINTCPPAQGFKINMFAVSNNTVADLINRERS